MFIQQLIRLNLNKFFFVPSLYSPEFLQNVSHSQEYIFETQIWFSELVLNASIKALLYKKIFMYACNMFNYDYT